MGSGPTCHLASKYNPGANILMSSYTSIKQAAREKFGFLSSMVSEQFDNLSIINRIQSPILFIHGAKDNLISPNHSEQLRAKCMCKTYLLIPENMTHNDFDYFKDLIRPILKFFSQINLSTMQNTKINKIEIQEMYYGDQDFVRVLRWERMKNHHKKKADAKAAADEKEEGEANDIADYWKE